MDITSALLASLNVTRAQFEARLASLAAQCSKSDKLVLAACVRLYAAQTADEKAIAGTIHDNGVGFQHMDAKFGSRMARLIAAGVKPSESSMLRLRAMARKYRNQLAVLSFRKEQAKVRADAASLLDRLDRKASVREYVQAVYAAAA